MLTTLNNSLVPTTLATPTNRLSALLDSFFNEDDFAPLTRSTGTMPLSMWEDEDHFYIEADVPGMREEDIDVSVHNGTVVIRGERKSERKENGYDCRSYGQFEQRVSLPNWAQADAVEARLTNGVLALSFPKSEEAKPRKIAIKSE